MNTQKSLYTILGVEPGATDDEVRRAFRRLAHASHPDTSEGPMADATSFREVVHAYRVLSDPSARAEYDRTLAARPSASWRRIEVRTGADAVVRRTESRESVCATCHGLLRVANVIPCPSCAGTGTIVELDPHRAQTRRCVDCRGGGRVRASVACPACSAG